MASKHSAALAACPASSSCSPRLDWARYQASEPTAPPACSARRPSAAASRVRPKSRRNRLTESTKSTASASPAASARSTACSRLGSSRRAMARVWSGLWASDVVEVVGQCVIALPMGQGQAGLLVGVQSGPEQRGQGGVEAQEGRADAGDALGLDQCGGLQLPAQAGPGVAVHGWSGPAAVGSAASRARNSWMGPCSCGLVRELRQELRRYARRHPAGPRP